LVGVFLRQVLIQLGWLDSIALAASKFLAVHVSPSLVGWTAALILALALYGFFLWKVWKPPRLVYRDRHHLGRQAETAPVAGLGMDVSRAAPAPQTPLGPRLLSAQQQLALIGELSPLSPEVGTSQVLFTPSGNESHGYWEGFLEVFTRAGLKPHVGTDVPRSPEEVGVMVVVAGQGAAEDLSGRLVAALHNVGIDAHLIERDNPQGFDLRLFIGPQPL
jgi:hypothetical protein